MAKLHSNSQYFEQYIVVHSYRSSIQLIWQQITSSSAIRKPFDHTSRKKLKVSFGRTLVLLLVTPHAVNWFCARIISR
jgi:hypothetical protein